MVLTRLLLKNGLFRKIRLLATFGLSPFIRWNHYRIRINLNQMDRPLVQAVQSKPRQAGISIVLMLMASWCVFYRCIILPTAFPHSWHAQCPELPAQYMMIASRSFNIIICMTSKFDHFFAKQASKQGALSVFSWTNFPHDGFVAWTSVFFGSKQFACSSLLQGQGAANNNKGNRDQSRQIVVDHHHQV